MLRFIVSLTLVLASHANPSAQIDVEFDEDRRHHVPIFTAGTHIFEADETGFTLGLDYEYRLNRLLGVGFVGEYAFGELDATTLLTFADIHVWKGLALQVGPEIESIDDEEFAIGRFGALYEIEFLDHLTRTLNRDD